MRRFSDVEKNKKIYVAKMNVFFVECQFCFVGVHVIFSNSRLMETHSGDFVVLYWYVRAGKDIAIYKQLNTPLPYMVHRCHQCSVSAHMLLRFNRYRNHNKKITNTSMFEPFLLYDSLNLIILL